MQSLLFVKSLITFRCYCLRWHKQCLEESSPLCSSDTFTVLSDIKWDLHWVRDRGQGSVFLKRTFMFCRSAYSSMLVLAHWGNSVSSKYIECFYFIALFFASALMETLCNVSSSQEVGWLQLCSFLFKIIWVGLSLLCCLWYGDCFLSGENISGGFSTKDIEFVIHFVNV